MKRMRVLRHNPLCCDWSNLNTHGSETKGSFPLPKLYGAFLVSSGRQHMRQKKKSLSRDKTLLEENSLKSRGTMQKFARFEVLFLRLFLAGGLMHKFGV